ncbi:MAG: hypothetical protein AAF653_13080 [Chloroflexota bacterium]
MAQKPDNRTPLERLMRMGWDALDAARRNDPLTLEQVTANTRNAIENVRRGILDEKSLKSFQFTLPLDNAVGANVEIELSVGESRIFALEHANNVLMDAMLHYLGSISYGVSGDVERMAYLRQSTPLTIGWANPVHWATRPHWDVGLAPALPLDLRVQGGVGDVELNLTGLHLRSLRLEGNIGRMNVTLPSAGPTFTTDIRGGAGPIALNVPDNATTTVKVAGGVGGFALMIALGAAVQMSVAGGVGKTLLTPGFNRTEVATPGLPNTGTWQTPDFDMHTRQVRVQVADTVVGNLSARVMAPA